MTTKIAQDGYSNKTPTLTEGYVRKGGSNTGMSQVQTRPPAPAAMKPGAGQGTSQTTGTQGNGNKQ